MFGKVYLSKHQNVLNSSSLTESADIIQQMYVWVPAIGKASVNTILNKMIFNLKEFMGEI